MKLDDGNSTKAAMTQIDKKEMPILGIAKNQVKEFKKEEAEK